LAVPADKLPPPISVAKARYFQKNPAAWSEFVAHLPQRPGVVAQASAKPASPPTFGGSWADVTAAPGSVSGFCNPLLLTDGTVLIHDCDLPDWWKLTPDITGSYVNGTWTQVASLPVIDDTQYAPLYFSSAVLPDGRVIAIGGEYNGSNTEVWTSLGAIYDPLANTWTPVTHASSQNTIGDAQSVVLANGTFMLGSCCDAPDADTWFNATNLSWTSTGAPSAGGDYQDEQNYNLLPNGKVLTVDIWTCENEATDCESQSANPTNVELYTPSSGLWSPTGSTVTHNTLIGSTLVDPYQCGNFEIGPAALRPDGSLVGFGGNSGCSALTTALGNTAAADPISIYSSSAGTWSAAPNVPAVCNNTASSTQYCTLADAPAAVLPNGNVLFAASGGYALATGTFFFEFTSAASSPANTPEQVASELHFTSGNPSYLYNFLVLPTGQVLSADQSSTAEIYTPTGAATASWKPTITSAPASIYAGATYPISGTQFNGLTQGAYYGDDAQASTNYPIVKITNVATGHVFYARTFNHSTMSIASGTSGSTNFTVPENVETGPSTLVVIANGIPSAAVSVAAQHSGYAKPPHFHSGGDSDLLLHNNNGDIQIWLMNGGTVTSKVDVGILDNEWSIVGTGDLNGDGISDILLRNNATGDLQAWLMKTGGTISSIIDLGTVANAWTVVGTGDFNGDGKTDILWRNANGAVEIWFSDPAGTGKHTSSTVLGTVDNSWTIVGTGDFDGNGTADILWHNTNGAATMWLMSGGAVLSKVAINSVATTWTIVGTGDFDGDGKTDILWHNSDGAAVIWFMSGTGRTSTASFGPVPTAWSIVATSAFSGGDSDMLWRNASGATEIWFMTGSTHTSTTVLGTFPFTITIVQ
jgi:hypothetical protein